MTTAPVDGASFTQMTSDMVRDTWCSSDSTAADLERAQFELGEGPSQDAFNNRRAIFVPDLAAPRNLARWPTFVMRTAHLDVGSVFAVPMQIGVITAGICLAYRHHPGSLSGPETAALLRAVDAATLTLLALRSESGTESDPLLGSLPRTVHQATGMVAAQLGASIETAFARLRAHAYASGRSLDQVAADVVGRRLRLEPDPPDPIQFS